MAEEKKVDLLDYLIILVKWKKTFLLIAIITAIISYLTIYFLIEEQFDAKALIVPTEDASMSGLVGLLGNLEGNLPFGFGSSTSPEMNLYNTIIYSRTNLQNIIDEFDLYDDYNLDSTIKDYKEEAIKKIAGNITADETEYSAYEIGVRTNSPQLSADIANYIVRTLNKKLIELRTEKSKNNRIFLEDRVGEIREKLRGVEDSLMEFQKKSGILEPEEQFKGIISAYSTLETELITKQIEKSILEKIRDKNSPLVESITLQVKEFQNRLSQMKKEGTPEGMIPSLDLLPEKAMIYYRLYREIEIDSKILEFVLPLYEQAKIEEKKDIPTLQVIDSAIPPARKSFPPRTIFTLLLTVSVLVLTFIFIMIKENKSLQGSVKMIFLKENLFKWKTIS